MFYSRSGLAHWLQHAQDQVTKVNVETSSFSQTFGDAVVTGEEVEWVFTQAPVVTVGQRSLPEWRDADHKDKEHNRRRIVIGLDPVESRSGCLLRALVPSSRNFGLSEIALPILTGNGLGATQIGDLQIELMVE